MAALRMSRLKKFKSNKKLILISKVIAIGYLSIFTIGYLTSGTEAYFNDTNVKNQQIQAGTWWDGSDLQFVGKNTQNIKTCPPTDITVKVKNNGFTMLESTKYEIYYVENGNPKNKGKKIAEGQISPIDAGETTTLSYKADQKGSYMFKALQRPGHEEDYDERHELWSEKVMVKCLDEQQEKEDPQQENEKEKIKDNDTEESAKEIKDEKTEESSNQTEVGQPQEDESTEEIESEGNTINEEQEVEAPLEEKDNSVTTKESTTEQLKDSKSSQGDSIVNGDGNGETTEKIN